MADEPKTPEQIEAELAANETPVQTHLRHYRACESAIDRKAYYEANKQLHGVISQLNHHAD